MVDLEVDVVAVDRLTPDERNARVHDPRNLDAIRASLRRFGQRRPLVVTRDYVVVAGNGTLAAAVSLGWDEVAVTVFPSADPDEARAYAIADNRTAELAAWDEAILIETVGDLTAAGWGADLATLGFGEWMPDRDGDGDGAGGDVPAPTLAERFVVPPFSILDARQGVWQERKRRWLALGIRSEDGRARDALFKNLAGLIPSYYKQKDAAEARLGRALAGPEFEADHLVIPEGGLPGSGTSVFDPVLCELAYRWFSPPTGHILDPFAGGSVRGVIAAALGRAYTGVELRAEQVEENRGQARTIVPRLVSDTGPAAAPMPEWIVGDSTALDAHLPPGARYDIVFSCPPYADLEVYSDEPADLSRMPYAQFLDAYRSIIRQAVDRLAPDRFAVWVVGEVRDKRGMYRDLVGDTVQAFRDAGADYYNEAVLLNPVGSIPVRLARQFTAGRKLGKTHQNVLVFVKGDPKVATEACGHVDVTLPEDDGVDGGEG